MTEYGRIHTDGSRSGGQPVLKPCPFCGGVQIEAFHHIDRGWGASWHVECVAEECGNSTCHHDTEATAIAAWNTRQPTHSDDCPKCDKLGDDCGEHAPSWKELAAYWKAENAQLRHDLERQMDIANEHVNEAERLRRALTHIAFSGADGPYGEFGEALNEHQMRRVAKAALKE